MKEFKNKVAVITGAASGIGLGLAERAAREGMKVVLADVEETALREAEQSLRASGAEALAVPTDVSRLSDVEALAARTLEQFGGVHLLCNNAGVQTPSSLRQPLWENTVADWQWLLDVNLWGVIHGVRVFTPIMLKQGTASHIVNTASMAGLIAEPDLVIYAVTKAGVIKISEGLYLQLKREGAPVGVSVLCPAFVTSRLVDAERNRPPELKDTAGSGTETPSKVGELRNDRNIMSRGECAEVVFRAVREGRFYIFTDPLVTDLFRQRSDAILQGRNPETPH